MNHSFFEELILDRGRDDQWLEPEWAGLLQEHLQTCAACRALAESWGEVESSLKRVELASPAPGFAARWQERAQAERLRRHRRQSLLMLAFAMTGGLLVLGSLVLAELPWLRSPEVVWWAWVYQMVQTYATLQTAGEFLAVIFQSAGRIVPVGWWPFIFGVLTEFAVLWFVSYRKLLSLRKVTQ